MKSPIVPSRGANLASSSSGLFSEIRALVALHCELLSIVSLIGRTMYFHSRSLLRLVGCVFRTNSMRAFFHV